MESMYDLFLQRTSLASSAQIGTLTATLNSNSSDMTPSHLLCNHMHDLKQILIIKYLKSIFKLVATSKTMNVMKRYFVHYLSPTFSILHFAKQILRDEVYAKISSKGKVLSTNISYDSMNFLEQKSNWEFS